MATITGLTAAAMQAIVDATVAASNVVGDNLILTLRNGSQVNAGNVRGPQGDKGDQGIQGIQGPGNATDPDVANFVNTSGTATQSGILALQKAGHYWADNAHRPTSPWKGQLGFNNTLGYFEYWNGTAWTPFPIGQKRSAWKNFSGTTDASGYLTIAHGLPWTPTVCVVTGTSPLTAGSNVVFEYGVVSKDATNIRIRALFNTGGQASSIAITFDAFLGE